MSIWNDLSVKNSWQNNNVVQLDYMKCTTEKLIFNSIANSLGENLNHCK